jgi:hypothetical protein
MQVALTPWGIVMKHKVCNKQCELFGGDFSPRDEKRIRREYSVTDPPVFKEEIRLFFFIFFFLNSTFSSNLIHSFLVLV